MAFDVVTELERLVDAFTTERIDYAICGGLALAIHGHPRMTKDLDMLVPRDQLDRAVEVARSVGFDIPARKTTFGLARGTPHELRRVSKLDDATGALMPLDLMVVGGDWAEVWAARIIVPWNTREVCVVSRAGLATMKRLAGRPQDLADLAVLEGTAEPDDA